LAHGLLRGLLCRGDQRYRNRAAKPRDGIGIAHRLRRFVGKLGIFVDDDNERGPGRGYVPGTLAG
jgi:hypothetical protein